jgi:hypothetical protein
MTLTNEELNIASTVRDFGEGNDLDLSWLDTRGEWGVKADTGERSENLTGGPRGSVPRSDACRGGRYQIRSKSDIWLTNASALYEEVLQRQWSSDMHIRWSTIKPLPSD